MEYRYKFTVFTPTYNRARTLPRVYDSLLKQTLKDFEWIIVNDGSLDNTDDIVKNWLAEGSIPITYIKQPNRGKHIAQNVAVKRSNGLLFLPLDSDDTITSDALEVLWNAWSAIPFCDRKQFSGIGVHCMDQTGNIIGDRWPNQEIISNDLEIALKYKVKGEKWGPIRTDILLKFPNDEVRGHYLSESTIWYRIAEHYKKKYIDKCLRIYEIHDDSVQKNKKGDLSNAESKICSSLIYINEFWPWFRKYNVRQGIGHALIAVKWTVLSGDPLLLGDDSLFKRIKPLMCKLVVCMGIPYKIIHLLGRKK